MFSIQQKIWDEENAHAYLEHVDDDFIDIEYKKCDKYNAVQRTQPTEFHVSENTHQPQLLHHPSDRSRQVSKCRPQLVSARVLATQSEWNHKNLYQGGVLKSPLASFP